MRNAVRLTLTTCMGFVLVLSGVTAKSQAQSQTAFDPLIGIWASETTFGPALQGELTVAREGPTWRATLSGTESIFHVAGNSVRFAFPGNLGQFRGELTENGRAIKGFWLQPSGDTADRRDPGGSGSPF